MGVNGRRIVVVLGMHRSGTSLIAESLSTCGVDLGKRLMPPASANNDKGFFEDLDIYALNERMLHAIGESWAHAAMPAVNAWQRLEDEGFVLEAVELIREKSLGAGLFGFKDPRTAILWPIWRKVLAHCGLAPSVVVALRHPLSVARSLERRDAMDRGKAYWLWIRYTLASLEAAQGADAWFLIDYDALLTDPETQLQRLSKALKLPLDQGAYARFLGGAIDPQLRHTLHTLDDLALDPLCPGLAVEMFEALRRWQVLPLGEFGAEQRMNVSGWSERYAAVAHNLAIADRLDDVIGKTRLALKESREQTREVRRVLLRELDASKQTSHEIQLLLDGARAEAQALEASIEQIYTSRSWRLTRPFRWFFDRLRAVRRHNPLRFVALAFKLLSGELQRHGLVGTLQRFPYYYTRRRLMWDYWRQKARTVKPTWMFQAEPAVSRPTRLHPDLVGAIQAIAVKISVVIPTLNPGNEFPMLLRKLKGQQGVDGVEVVIVDSGSTDGSVEVARQWGCTVVQIPPEDFSHSGARNLGAEHATGDYLLFMVQDAYPIGEHWMYGMLRYLLDHAGQELVAVSCAETPRSDSDMMYDSMIDTHYRFLGCRDQDRLGRLQGLDHMALRTQGQLSDVACLIRKDDFSRYRYRGDYAEDLDLGMRIIRDGKAVAMLASVKVIHSHNRPAFYYLKRSFVDVVFLVAMFDDFPRPMVRSVPGLIEGIDRVARHLSAWLLAQPDEQSGNETLREVLQSWLKAWRVKLTEAPAKSQQVALGDRHLDEALAALRYRAQQASALKTGDDMGDVQQFVDMFLGRVEHFGQYAASVYGVLDARLAAQLGAAIIKIFAASAGAALGFAYVQFNAGPRDEAELVQWIFGELKAGV